jgi:hypothetical protein
VCVCLQVWEGAVSADGRVDSDVRLALCCERTQELGATFYPNENRWGSGMTAAAVAGGVCWNT